MKMRDISIGSSGRVGEGGKKHEIYVAAFGSHLFYDLFVQGLGGSPLDPLLDMESKDPQMLSFDILIN